MNGISSGLLKAAAAAVLTTANVLRASMGRLENPELDSALDQDQDTHHKSLHYSLNLVRLFFPYRDSLLTIHLQYLGHHSTHHVHQHITMLLADSPLLLQACITSKILANLEFLRMPTITSSSPKTYDKACL